MPPTIGKGEISIAFVRLSVVYIASNSRTQCIACLNLEGRFPPQMRLAHQFQTQEVRVITYRRAGHNVLAEPAGHIACCLGPDNQSLSQSWWYCRYCVSLVSRQRQFETPNDWRQASRKIHRHYHLVDVQLFCHLVRFHSFWLHLSFSACILFLSEVDESYS